MQLTGKRQAGRRVALRAEPSLLRDAEALHVALSNLVRVYQFRDRDRICCYDISVTQCYALEALMNHTAVRSQALASLLRLDKSTTTRVVDALVRKGYAERAQDPDDGRAVSLRITRSGRALYRRINGELIEQQAALMSDLDPNVRAVVTEVIHRLADAAEARFARGVSVEKGAFSCAPGTPGTNQADCGVPLDCVPRR